MLIQSGSNSEELKNIKLSIQNLEDKGTKTLPEKSSYPKVDSVLQKCEQVLSAAENTVNKANSLEKELQTDIKTLLLASKGFVSYADAVKAKPVPTEISSFEGRKIRD